MFSIYLKFNFCFRIKKWKVFCLDILQKMRNRLILRKIFLIWIVFFRFSPLWFLRYILFIMMRCHLILLINIVERCMFIFFCKEASSLILQAHFHGLPAKVYFCGVHISLLRKYFFHARAGLFLRR